MAKYTIIYKFEIMDKLLDGEVYVLDRKTKNVYRASELTGAMLATIILTDNTARFEAWIEENSEGENE